MFVGHSASLTGNHKYSFKKLSKINIGNREIIVPINYNNNEIYGPYIESVGRKYCGDKCVFIKDFMPLNEYNNLMLQADRFIFNNWRQEAWGNIQIALYMGAKIFVARRSPVAKLMKDIGLHFEYTENLNQRTFDRDLTQHQKEENRRIITESFCMERSNQLCRKLSLEI